MSPGEVPWSLVNRLRKNWRHLRRWAEREGITAFRVYDRDMPEWPCAVDWYAGHALVTLYPPRREREADGAHGVDPAAGAGRRATVVAAVREVLGLGAGEVVVKTRAPKVWRREQHGKLAEAGVRVVVAERGLKFAVNLTDRIDTGLFLDHRNTRQRVREESAGRRVLNLFCYTGSFTVVAAAGGAAATTSVDLSNTALDRARENLALNGFRGARHELVRADVTRWLRERHDRRWDLAVVDPPAFSVSKAMAGSFEVQREHAALLRAVLRLLAPGGVLYFSTHLRAFRLDAAVETLAASCEEITPGSLPPDFHDRRTHRCWRLVAGGVAEAARKAPRK